VVIHGDDEEGLLYRQEGIRRIHEFCAFTPDRLGVTEEGVTDALLVSRTSFGPNLPRHEL
jgi:hypothetical protein